ncbi:MAG: transketolase [Candidatus Levybacteria bacterium RIFCSPHIGHO2_02_FULL_40_18]|nr:MAG: transketolase [Candidatus Levybacteria bacterium RIFCSPHIGHO2_01_FULL_40_58]OGH26511.1 MAG: transketolase [Candidatus Levybacteria bacterium RIFCSPHIGHO2_02_FULL_40_18]OGH31962.1 MAG: transketolase [Candidatus Levybacteria bacterium RIFCSPHIGHO2_12_FULL_40_31]OGH40528.1 MAG: transketolase [Candidatus Levybacteria bacterium RIFCSPLOWO2_01_FULL_40_64]OGH49461.1 MAG: transketolase [Candidatus Levybacteria bacterium RIFCSPLOWO2_02_FULL_41_11]OGH53914.1 MAG: transketolase [Candidatus Levyba
MDATRSGYGAGLVELGEQDPNVVVLCADLTESTKSEDFAKKFPDRFFEVGVAEQNMAAIAAGLGISGKTAFISSYATFSPGKNWETIRTTIIYNDSNVKIAGHHSGIMTGPDGATHQATEDIASVRAWPNIKIFVPCDAIEAKKATVEAGKIKGPVYLRFTRDKSPVMTTEKTPFEPGRIQVFWTSNKPQVVIFSMGWLLYQALLAAKELAIQGIEVIVANVSTIKPIDEKSILELTQKAGTAVSVEDHQITGGLGGAIAEVLVRNKSVPMEFVGLQNTFGESGKPAELIKKYKMDKDAVIAAVKKAISRK